jgi:hypothetical protein
MNNFNPEIYNLVLMASGKIDDDKIEFSKIEFENFMRDFVSYIQNRQEDIVLKSEQRNTYMGDDVPSFIMIKEVFKSITKQ